MVDRRFVTAVLLTAVVAALSGCKLIANEQNGSTEDGVDIFFDDKSFDPDKMASDIWSKRVIPYLTEKAGDFPEVMALAAKNPDEAGSRFGYRENAEGSPWSMVVRLEGTIVGAKLDTRAATIDVDQNGDGIADATVQIGPVIRGTVLRDSLDFVSFGSFTNQIDYAKFGKSLNTLVNTTILQGLPRENLVGRDVNILGVFELDPSAERPLITPAQISVTEPSS